MEQPFKILLDTILKEITINEQQTEIVFELEDGRKFKMYHQQECCEDVYVESVVGDIEDILGTEILGAEEAANRETDNGFFTWTFYKLRTRKGYLDIRWCGSSNGYYSEKVQFEQLL